jgi:hypothetical protein
VKERPSKKPKRWRVGLLRLLAKYRIDSPNPP